jgi:hypothetical protein
MLALAAGCLALARSAAAAEPSLPVRALYEAYVGGLPLAEAATLLDVGTADYSIAVRVRMIGLLGQLVPGSQDVRADGRWIGGRPQPLHFVGTGYWHGEPRQVEIDYDDAGPKVRRLAPPNDAEREPVPAELAIGAIDTLSALALVLRMARGTGRCEAAVTTFDGRRLIALTAETIGEEILPATSRSTFAGRALHCAFAGVQRAGFARDADRADLSHPRRASAWFAAVVPGAAPLPVRMTFPTKWFGEATMYLTEAAAAAGDH